MPKECQAHSRSLPPLSSVFLIVIASVANVLGGEPLHLHFKYSGGILFSFGKLLNSLYLSLKQLLGIGSLVIIVMHIPLGSL